MALNARSLHQFSSAPGHNAASTRLSAGPRLCAAAGRLQHSHVARRSGTAFRRSNRTALLCRADQQQHQEQQPQPQQPQAGLQPPDAASDSGNGNGVDVTSMTPTAATTTATTTDSNATTSAASSRGAAAFPAELLEGDELQYAEPDSTAKFWTSFKLAFALPWRRFKKNSVLSFKLEGQVSDQARSFFDPGLSMPALCTALRKAALDPRVQGVALEIGPLDIGWGKVMEIKRHIDHFRGSGKYIVAFMKQGAEKEYYLASACSELYAPPSAYISLRGFVTGGTFLRGLLDKAGVEPQVVRIGPYKSAGDQLLRTHMAPEQREQLTAIQSDIVEEFLRQVSTARGKTREEVVAFIEEGVYDMQRFKEGGWLTDLWYEDQLIQELKMRTTGLRPVEGEGQADRERRDKQLAKPLRRVSLRKYSAVDPAAFGLAGGRKKIAVLRTSGAILGKSSGASGAITPDGVIPKLRALAQDKSVAAVILRVDSPGGDALAAELLWRELGQLDERKPVIASMGDVAASGGYYMAMAARAIVAEPLTITGSIGVVSGKFNLAELYGKIGYSKELISWGRFAQLLADNRTFSEEEEALFRASAHHAYASFRDKAAASRGMRPEDMQRVAQGRVWSGAAASKVGLVDALGGLHRAVSLARHAAGLAAGEAVTLVEVGRAAPSPAALLGGGAMAAAGLLGLLLRGQPPASALAASLGAAGMAALGSGSSGGCSGSSSVAAAAAAALGAGGGGVGGGTAAQQMAALASSVLMQPGRCAYLMTDVDAASIGSSSSGSSSGIFGMGGGFGNGGQEDDGFLSEGGASGGLFGWWGW